VNDNTIAFELSNEDMTTQIYFAYIEILKCSKYETKNLVWVNRFGALDSYSFQLANKKNIQTEKKSYQRYYNGFGKQSVNGVSVFQNTNPIYYTKETQRITLNTNYLTEQESIAFRQLYSSPLIYLQATGDYLNDSAQYPHQSFPTISQTALLPVKLLADTYEIKQKVNEKLFQIEAEFEYSEPSYRQVI
jgi:hypothetical protein